MKIAPVADVKARLSRYLASCHDSPVMVTKNGRPTALLIAVPEGEEELERFLLANTPRFRKLLDAAAERIAREGGLRHGSFWSSLRPLRRRRRRARGYSGRAR